MLLEVLTDETDWGRLRAALSKNRPGFLFLSFVNPFPLEQVWCVTLSERWPCVSEDVLLNLDLFATFALDRWGIYLASDDTIDTVYERQWNYICSSSFLTFGLSEGLLTGGKRESGFGSGV